MMASRWSAVAASLAEVGIDAVEFSFLGIWSGAVCHVYFEPATTPPPATAENASSWRRPSQGSVAGGRNSTAETPWLRGPKGKGWGLLSNHTGVVQREAKYLPRGASG